MEDKGPAAVRSLPALIRGSVTVMESQSAGTYARRCWISRCAPVSVPPPPPIIALTCKMLTLPPKIPDYHNDGLLARVDGLDL